MNYYGTYYTHGGNETELYHSAAGGSHKYIARKLVNGKWRYYYKSAKQGDAGRSAKLKEYSKQNADISFGTRETVGPNGKVLAMTTGEGIRKTISSTQNRQRSANTRETVGPNGKVLAMTTGEGIRKTISSTQNRQRSANTRETVGPNGKVLAMTTGEGIRKTISRKKR